MKVAALRRKFGIFYHHIIKRRLPFGLFSWRFLLPGQTESVNFHRSLVMQFYPVIPRPIWLLIVLFVGFKWMLFYGPYYSYRVVNKLGKEQREVIGQTLWQQYWRVLGVSMGLGLAPASWYQYQLYRPKRDLWSYVYDQELPAYHLYRNRGRPQYEQAAALLGDKWRFEQYLLENGIPTTNTQLLMPQGVAHCRRDLEGLTQTKGRLFCKRRTGNQGKGAFSALWKEKRLQIKPLREKTLSNDEVDAFLRDNMSTHGYLIQPEYLHHQRIDDALKGLARPALTIRIISACSGENNEIVNLVFAVMYWTVIENGKTRFHYPLAIDLSSGTLDEKYPVWPRENLDEVQQTALRYFTKLLSGETLPFWEEAVELVHKSHRLIPGVDQIAWDLILSDERAVLLEGNSGWGGLAVCQWFGYKVYMGK